MRAGFTKFDITPKKLLPLDGYWARCNDNAQGIHDRLHGRICILEHQHKMVIFVTLDLLGVHTQFVERVKEEIIRRTQGVETLVLVSCTHTHSGPQGFARTFPISSNSFQQYSKEIRQNIENTVKKVLEGFERARTRIQNSKGKTKLSFGKSKVAAVSANRLDPEQNINQQVRSLLAKDEEGNWIGCLSNFACHPTILSHENMLYSGDLFGEATKKVEKLHPSLACLLTNGAEGDISTRFTREEQSFTEVQRLSSFLAEGIQRSLENAKPLINHGLCFESIKLKLPSKPLPGISTIKNQLKRVRDRLRKARDLTYGEGRKLQTELEALKILIKLRKSKESQGGEELEKIPIYGVRIGEIIFVSVPGEMFAQTWDEITAEAPAGMDVVLLGLTNGYVGYFPTRKSSEQKSYEALISKFSDNATRKVRDKVVEIINRLSEKSLS